LKQGGNAFGATIAVGAALGVVGLMRRVWAAGGFSAYRVGSTGRRSRCARVHRGGTRSVYIDAEGKPDEVNSINGALAAAVPGTPAGLVWLAQLRRLSLSVACASNRGSLAMV
jgi:gamma-glutamyltranspeptidase/glutathione hydrolase